MGAPEQRVAPSLAVIARQWGRIGCTGFGGPPAHVALLRELCVERQEWISEDQFEHALAATNMLPGPASTQLAIYCAWRLGGTAGALLGGVCFIAPGLALMIALSVLFLAGSPPAVVVGAGAGAGAAVAAVAVRAGLDVARPIWGRAAPRARPRMLAYALVGAAGAAVVGAWLVLVLLGCGGLELARRTLRGRPRAQHVWWPLPALARPLAVAAHRRPASAGLLAAAAAPAGVGALVWTSLKVGALAFGGGFVIVPLMQADAVGTYHWMTHAQFLNAVALGQVTPGPITQTVAAVGYAADGIAGALLAPFVAFAPSFCFVLLGARRFDALIDDDRVRAFLGGAGPAAAGAIIGAAVPLAAALGEGWQALLLAAAAVALLVLRRGVVETLLVCGGVGLAVALLGGPLP
jgi:chromate transporter